MKIKFNEFFLVIITYLGLLILFLLRSKMIGNPLVLPDETAYINLIGKISKFFIFDGAQYPPLYPFLASLVYKNEDILRSYDNIRILNVFIFSLAFFPMYYLVKRILNISNLSNLLLTLTIMVLPWSSLISPIWAEPLYFLLVTTTFLMVYLSISTNNILLYALTGFLIGLTFLTKQVGLILGIAFSLTQLVFLILAKNRKNSFFNLLATILPLVVIISTYKIANSSSIGSPGIGYSNVVNAMITRIGVIILKFDFYRSFFHQVTYISVSTFFIFFAGFLSIFWNFREHNRNTQFFSIFILLMTLGLCVFIAIFNNTVDVSYNDTNEPTLGYGRYLVALLPSIFILGSYSLFKAKSNFKFTFSTLLVIFALTSYFTPLHSSFVAGLVGNPDVTYLCQLFNQDFPPWDRSIIENNLRNLPLILSLVFLLFSLSLYFVSAKSHLTFNLIIFTLAFYVGYKNFSYTVSFSGFQREENEIYSKIAEQKVNLENVLIYDKFSASIYISQFWNGFFDFAGWAKNEIITKNDLNLKNEKLVSGKYIYILANKNDLNEFPSYFEKDTKKVILVSDIKNKLSGL